MFKKITTTVVRAFLCLKNFKKDTIKSIAEETISHQIARYKEPTIYQRKIGEGQKRSIRSRELSILSELSFAEIKLEWLKRSRQLLAVVLFLFMNHYTNAQAKTLIYGLKSFKSTELTDRHGKT
ncbi:hypothetical protein [Pedobacter sp. N23S346]|uniref:hypothetical protein n=1 Tax=Pedobacter sp. N23S346 TaxID=3402750 RepID=UPI003AD322CA